MTKLLARLARYPVPPAMELDTSSSIAKCGGQLRPLLKKSQYRINTLNPSAEAISYHTIGASPLAWGEWRNVPATGEDHTFVIWRKRNCCLSLTGD
jgi:conjugal transfer pilus assembly protein TraU